MTINSMNITGEGLQIFNPSDGSFTPIDLTTKGDMLVYDGTNYQRLPVGADDEVLTADSAEALGVKYAANAAGAGAWTFISSTTASNDATIEFTDLDSSYIQYQWVITGLVPATDSVYFWIRTSTDNGSTFSGGASDYSYAYNGGTDLNANANAIRLADLLGSDTNEHSDLYVNLFNPSDSGLYTRFTALGSYRRSIGTDNTSVYSSAGSRNAAEDVDAVRFQFSSGNIESGTFRLYGLNPS